MSRNYAEKLRLIRKAEGLTQATFAELTGISISTIKSYETGHQTARAETVEKVISTQPFEKYTLWLMTDKTAPIAGQVSPTLSPDGHDNTTSPRSTRKTG
ncbi:XRE family transcriptional regulator [Enterobacter sp. WCHEn045836]|uniref:helix-turn-helix transcriptional regulator n=1 Tax=Enterobacter sp. WCHEn045836 TaxID=2497434 RepID=UPI000F831805|nr:helix-turn-helix transcriptional regulator [Enterobacter sp. WCHEn045836]RTP98364.1 XRE family transcriptional regulator [Enterobacter sp. WCHEn045836]